MKYWARTVPPLKMSKGFFETTKELEDWMKKILSKCSQKIDLEKNPDPFLVFKVETNKFPMLNKIFKSKEIG